MTAEGRSGAGQGAGLQHSGGTPCGDPQGSCPQGKVGHAPPGRGPRAGLGTGEGIFWVPPFSRGFMRQCQRQESWLPGGGKGLPRTHGRPQAGPARSAVPRSCLFLPVPTPCTLQAGRSPVTRAGTSRRCQGLSRGPALLPPTPKPPPLLPRAGARAVAPAPVCSPRCPTVLHVSRGKARP